MAIERDDVVLPPGLYELNRRAPTPDGLTDPHLRKAAFSLHHILPYRYPLFAGFLLERFRDRYYAGERGQGWPRGAGDDYSAMAARLLHVVGKFGPLQASLQTQMAWMGPNLFQGPSGNFRLDDPKGGREPNRPHSLRVEVWGALLEVGALIDSMAVLLSEDGNQAKVTRPIRVADFARLLRAFEPVANTGRSNAWKFKPDDWIILVSNGPSYKLKADATVTADFLRRFRGFEAEQSHLIDRFKPPKLPAPPWRPVIWRLRLAGEMAPTQEFPNPALQP